MYIFPGSQPSNKLRGISIIPDRLKPLLIDGFQPIYNEGQGYYQLCQHYDHPEADLYQYHIYSDSAIQLFSKAEASRWVVGYLQKGEMQAFFYDGNVLNLTPPCVLFFQTFPGKEIRFDIGKGVYQLVCCCLKTGFDTILHQFFPTILDTSIRYPIFLDCVSYAFRYEWDRLLDSGKAPVNRIGFYAGQLRILLNMVCDEYLIQLNTRNLQEAHPGIDKTIVQKAYEVKRIIDSKLGDTLSLSLLTRETGWNLQGLKSGFLKVFGLTPHQYIIQYRMKVAYDLIQKSDDLNIQAISITCGYKQPHHFIKQFKAIYGKTPGEIRKGIS